MRPSTASSAAISSSVSARRTSPSAACAIRSSESVLDAQPLPAQAALVVVQRALQRLDDVLAPDRVHHVHAATREQGRIELERGILGGRADEQDHAFLDVRQEGILLRLVEAVHLVHEQHRAHALGEIPLGLGQRLAHVGQARQHRGDGAELGIGVFGHQQRQRGLAAARRTPQHHRVHAPFFQRPPQGRARSDQPRLADDLVQAARTHALGQRLERLRLGEQPGCGGGVMLLHAGIIGFRPHRCMRGARASPGQCGTPSCRPAPERPPRCRRR